MIIGEKERKREREKERRREREKENFCASDNYQPVVRNQGTGS